MFVKFLSVFLYLSLCIRHINFTFSLICFCPHFHLGCFWQNRVNKLRSSPAHAMNTEQRRQRERWRRDVAERNTSSRPVALSNTRHTHCQSSWWLWKTAPLPPRLVLLASAVHHLCPAFLLLLRKFVQGAVLLGVRKLSEDCEKLFWKLVWSSYLGWLGMQFGGNIVIIIIIIIVLLHFIHGVVFKALIHYLWCLQSCFYQHLFLKRSCYEYEWWITLLDLRLVYIKNDDYNNNILASIPTDNNCLL